MKTFLRGRTAFALLCVVLPVLFGFTVQQTLIRETQLQTSGVTAATYGDSTHVAQVTVNAQGFVTSASSVAISAGSVSSVGLSLPNIFSVTGSPVTSSGTLTATLATQSANTVWAGPGSGPAAAPGFRALVSGDLPTAGTAGTYGGSSKLLSVTTDAYGRVTGATEVNLIESEDLSSQLDGVTTTLTLAHSPVSGTLRLYRNGARQRAGSGKDYTISGGTITTASAWASDEVVLADYRY